LLSSPDCRAVVKYESGQPIVADRFSSGIESGSIARVLDNEQIAAVCLRSSRHDNDGHERVFGLLLGFRKQILRDLAKFGRFDRVFYQDPKRHRCNDHKNHLRTIHDRLVHVSDSTLN
jgi:hypothetical protein